MKPVGSQIIMPVRVYGPDRVQEVRARVDLFGTDVGVVVQPRQWLGYLIVPRWEDVISRLPADQRRRYRWQSGDLRFQLVNGVYRAGRQMTQVLAHYGLMADQGERESLREIRRLNRELNEAIVGLKRETFPEHRRRIVALVRGILAKPGLSRPRSLQKRELQEILLRLETVRDSLGRLNEGALLAASLKAIYLTEERLLGAIMRIEPVVAMRRQMLIGLINWAEEVMRDVIEFLSLLDADHGFQAADSVQTKRIQNRLWQLAQDLDGIDFRPYLVTARHGAYELRQAAVELGRGQISSFSRLICTTQMSFRLKENQIAIERVINRLLMALLRPNESVTYQREIDALSAVEGRLKSIDESGFVRPAVQRALSLLQSARELLELQNRAFIGNARDFLKQATDELTGDATELRQPPRHIKY